MALSGDSAFSVAICGAGASGICLGVHLKKAGIPFVIYEQEENFGGTWLKNVYPDAACDVEAMLYQYSFALKGDWSRTWPKQPELLEYFCSVAREHGLEKHTQFKTKVKGAVCDPQGGNKMWEVEVCGPDGKTRVEKFSVFVSAIGQLDVPQIPHFKGLDRFQGKVMHTSTWDKSVDLSGKNVVGVGTGPSAIQAFPAIAQQVKHLSVMQRSPTWFFEKKDHETHWLTKWIFSKVPFVLRIYRTCKFYFSDHVFLNWVLKKESRINLQDKMKKDMKDVMKADLGNKFEQLKQKVTPDFPIGCKRLALSSDWYPMLARNNVDLVCSPIASIDQNAVHTADGKVIPCDVFILATGYQTTNLLSRLNIRRKDGMTLQKLWAGVPRAYKSVSVAGFPNMFLLYGPGSNLGHSSIVFMVERCVEYILRLLQFMQANNYVSVDTKEEAWQRDFEALQKQIRELVFSGSNCTNWYKTADGIVVNNWGSTCRAFKNHLAGIDTDDLIFQ